MRVSPKLLIFEILAFLVFAVLVAAGALAWRLSQGPIDLAMFRTQIESSLSDARGGRKVKIEKVVLEWVTSRNRVEAVAHGFNALDAKGATEFRAERATISLDAASLVSGKFKTTQIRLENGSATVVRSPAGVWTLADIVIAREPDQSKKPFDPLRDINWTTLATPIRALISAGSFERVELVNFNLQVRDQKSKQLWSANPVAGVWSATEAGVALDLSLKLAGSENQPNKVVISLASDGAVSKATGRLTMERVDPLSVAKIFGYAGDGFVSASPANASFTIEATEKGGLQSTRVTLADVKGTAKLGTREINVGGLAFDAVYDPAAKSVKLDSLNVASDIATGSFSGVMDVTAVMAGDATKPVPIKLSGKEFTLGLMPVFEAPWAFREADLDVLLSTDLSRVVVSHGKAVTGDLTLTGNGEVWLDGPPDAKKIGVKVNAVGEGFATPLQIVNFWPVKLGSGARGWVKDHIPDAKAAGLVLKLDWQPGAASAGYLPDDKLTLDFSLRDGTVKFLPDFPPVTGVIGKGQLRGNSITLDATAGQLNSWQVDEGRVVIPQFAPRGKEMDITVSGRGELGPLMRVLDASNLKVGTRYGLVVDQMVGTGGLELNFKRPIADVVEDKDMRYTIKGGFRESAAPNLVSGFGLSDSDVTFELTESALSIRGAGQFGPAPVVFDWKERFLDVAGAGKGSELTASARVNPDLLNAFGIAARNFMQGEAAVELHAAGPGGRDFSAITASLDLTQSQLDIAEFGWRKKYDAPAKGSFRYGKDDNGAVMTGDIRADGLELVGEARMDKAGEFNAANIERIYSRDSVDLHGAISKRADGGFKVAVAGPFFDASPWMDSFLSMKSETPDTDMHGEPVGVGGPAEPGPAFEINLDADKLRLRDNAEMTNAKVAMLVDGEGPRSGTVTGNLGGAKRLNVAINTVDGKQKISIKSDDAGFGARVLLKADYLVGGKLTVDGTFGGDADQAMVTMSDVRLKNAPLVAQLFSLASLQGLSDVLNGDGVLFTEVSAPVKFQDGRIDLPGMRASGPAMGITARGWIAPGDSELSLDGVLVPSFGVNSLLGGLPIIGDLFVSRQGEGMFAPTYSVRGTFAKARVAINPVAAITPGVLRRIFENPSEPPPEAATPPQPPVAQNQRSGVRQ